MRKRITTFILIAIFSIVFSLEANAATQTYESCTEENAQQIQDDLREQDQSDGGDGWGWLGYIW